MHKVVHRTVGAVLFAGLLSGGLASAAAAAPPAERKTAVDHKFSFSLTAPDDICGPYVSDIIFSVRTQTFHLTEEPDGRFNAQWTQTGTYHVDFADPARPDQDSQYTDSMHHVFTPGKVEVFNETFHDFPDGIKIWVRIHATILDGRFVVERVVERITGCPS
jgi:hypothetical protein